MKEVSLAATEGQTPQPSPPRGGRINLFGGLVVVILLVGALFVSGLGGALDSVPSLHTLAAGTVSLDSAAPEAAACGEGAWSLLLVNRDSPLPDGYQVELTHLSNGQSVDKRIYPALQAMFDAARAQGVYPVVASGFRTAEKQQSLLDEKIAAFEAQGDSPAQARENAEDWVALPGTSEHQTGLAVDINADGIHSAGREVYRWLDQNAYRYGFILRYPSDKTGITGISNEPWHYRYVGVTAAAEIRRQNLCLEEYLNQRTQQ